MKFILILTLVFLCGCSMFQKKKPDATRVELDVQRHKILKEFEKANDHLDNREFKEAKNIYNDLLKKNPVTSLDLIVLFNSGIAYEGLGKCKTAAKRYRRVVRAAKKQEKLKTFALFRLSYAYICLGQNSKAIVNLIDVRKRRKHLPDEVAWAEVPARLAAAYARNGNRKLAQRYFKEAELGIRKLQTQHNDPNVQKETLAKTLYLMGNMKQLNLKSLEWAEYLESLRSLQGYLLQSIELGSKKWSPQAKEQLSNAYDKIWNVLLEPPQKKSKNEKSKRARAKEMAQVAQDAIFSIEKLRGLQFPDSKNSPLVKELFRDMQRQESRLRNYLADNQVGNSLTTEAQKREGLKRQGRTANPNPVLEKRFKKPTVIPEKKTQ